MSEFLVEIARRSYNFGATGMDELDALVSKGTLTAAQANEFIFLKTRRDFYLLRTVTEEDLGALVDDGRITGEQRDEIINYTPRTQELVSERTRRSYL